MFFKPGDHGGTFGGNALACAAIYATLTTIKNENILEQTAEKGAYFKKKLEFLLLTKNMKQMKSCILKSYLKRLLTM